MAAQEEWCFEEEGCLQFSGRPISVTFSPTSNCFICTLEDGTIEVLDARSSLRLKHAAPAGKLRSDEACVQTLHMSNCGYFSVRNCYYLHTENLSYVPPKS